MPVIVDTAQASAEVKPASGGALRTRVLPVEEWPTLGAYGPFLAAGGVLPDPEHARVMVLEWEGHIVGCWMARDIVMLEGLFLSLEQRHRVSAAKTLLTGMLEELNAAGVTQAITLIQDPYIARMAEKANFVKLEGAVYLLTLAPDQGGT